MKKERQIGVRAGLPVFFALELEDVYKHAQGAHRALAFPDFPGFLIGLGLETYRKQYRQEEAPNIPPEEVSGEYDKVFRVFREPAFRAVKGLPERERRAKT